MSFRKGALTLGDIVFDPRRVLYIKSLRSVVCLGLFETAPLAPALTTVLDAIQDYGAETLVVIGQIPSATPLVDLADALGQNTRVQLVADTKDEQIREVAESNGFELHPELVWAKYRFVEELEIGAVELYFVSAIGGAGSTASSFCIKVGRTGFGGMVLPVFLKGLGQIIMPAISPECKKRTVFQKLLARYDALAVGHQRVFPLGKIADLKTVKTFGRIPMGQVLKKGKRSTANGKPVA